MGGTESGKHRARRRGAREDARIREKGHNGEAQAPEEAQSRRGTKSKSAASVAQRRREGTRPAGRPPGRRILLSEPLMNGPPSSSERAAPRRVPGNPARDFPAGAGPRKGYICTKCLRGGPEGLRGGAGSRRAGRGEERQRLSALPG